MKVVMARGKYVLAVSGGVDSMVLLDLLVKKPGVKLVVAHFNHGIRKNAYEDEFLVSQTAKSLNLPFEVGHGRLGPSASEETARNARYEFLRAVKNEHGAGAIITGHHQDDYLETAILNLIRGTGSRGLAAIKLNKEVVRPLLRYPKSAIRQYAIDKKLVWREDESNSSDIYLRNHIRNNVLKDLNTEKKLRLIKHIDEAAEASILISEETAKLSRLIMKDKLIDRSRFAQIPSAIGDELIVYWLRRNGVADYDRKIISRVSNAIRTSCPHTVCPVKDKLSINFTAKTARFTQTV